MRSVVYIGICGINIEFNVKLDADTGNFIPIHTVLRVKTLLGKFIWYSSTIWAIPKLQHVLWIFSLYMHTIDKFVLSVLLLSIRIFSLRILDDMKYSINMFLPYMVIRQYFFQLQVTWFHTCQHSKWCAFWRDFAGLLKQYRQFSENVLNV